MVQLLLRESESVFCVPSARAGTVWEISEIVRERRLLAKTLFIKPPRVSKGFAFDEPSILEALKTSGVSFPDFPDAPCGFGMELNDGGALQVGSSVQFTSVDRKKLREGAALVSRQIRKSLSIRRFLKIAGWLIAIAVLLYMCSSR